MTVFVETRGSGPPLALLHGWGLNGAVWQSIADELAAEFTLHIVDLPGHGESNGAVVSTLSAMADAVSLALPRKTNLLGWSLGGQVAIAIAARHPAQVNKLALVATTPKFIASPDWPHGMKPHVLVDFADRLTKNYAATIRNFLALQALHQEHVRPTIIALQKAVLARGAPNIAALDKSLTILAESDLRGMLAAINCKSLVIQGDHDALTPEPAANWLASQLPGTRYRMIAHAAHAPFLSHRHEFMTVLKEFMA
jgi:pimeloyl-[acyl-carrier protein] methyl ester esterase